MILRVGVIGGGQLARMMIPEAIALGLEIKVFAEQEGMSASIATETVGDYTEAEELGWFADGVDVITFDHEHVPVQALEQLERVGVSVQPPSKALIFAQNKLFMRQRLSDAGLPMPKWLEVKTKEELEVFIKENDGKVIVKTPIGGYDGKGVRVITSAEDVSDWFERLAALGGSLLAEQLVEFDSEIAVISARRPSGEWKAWPAVQTIQKNGVCSQVIAPAPKVDQDQALEIARKISEQLEVTGVMAVEMFQTSNGELLINELAMRPHNSGHFTIDASVTSQFEQHLRAVLDLPLGLTEMTSNHAVMVNLLGLDSGTAFLENYEAIMYRFPEAKIHTYGKLPRPGRKMGHVTVAGDDLETVKSRALLAAAVVSGS